MADLEKTVKIIFEGEDKQLSAAVGNFAKKFDSLSGIADNIAGPLSQAADGILKLDAALAALAIGGMALSIKKAGEFGDSFREISTLIDASKKDIGIFRKEILTYAQDSDKSLEDINAAVYKAISAGIDYRRVLDSLKIAEQLAQAGRNDLASTTVLLAGTMNAYGAKTAEATRYADVFMQTVRMGLTTLPELAASLANVTGVAAMGKVPIETLAAAVAALTSTGMPTEAAITGLKNVISNIINPTKEASEMAARLGIGFDAVTLKTVGLQKILWDAWRATKGNADAMSTLFGSIRGLNAATVLAADSGGKFKKILEEMAHASGTLGVASEKMVGQFEDVNQKIKNNIDVTLISIGDRFLASYNTMGEGLANIFKGIKAAVDAGAFNPLFDALDHAGKELSTWLAGVAKALPEALKGLDFSALLDALRSLGGAIGEYFGNLDLTNVEDLHGFIQKIIDGIAGLIKVTSGMVEGFRPFFTAITDFLLSVAKSDEETQKMIGTLLALGKAVNSFGLGLVAAVTVIDKYGLSIEGAFKTISGGAQVMWNGLQILGNAIGMLFVLLEKALLEFVNMLSGGYLSRFSQAFRDMQATVEQSGMELRESLIQNGADAARGLDKMIDGFDKLGQQSGKTEKEVAAALKTIAAIPAEKVTTWKFEGAEEIKNAILGIGKEIVSVETAAAAGINVPVQTEIVWETVEIVTEELNKKIPSEKKVEVTLNAEKVKEQSAVIQKMVEWKAKLDISAIEEATKQMKIMFDSVDAGIKSTGDLMGTLFGQLKEASAWNRGTIESQIKEESQRRNKEFELQEKLITAETDYKKAKTDALLSGKEFMIKIEASGLEPHIEAFIWKILEKIQVRGNAEAAEFLLGWSATTPAVPG